jgi:CRP-like cAMP-binding protein
MTAATRESVTAAVTRLRRERILAMGAGRIVLLDPKRLAEIGRR